MDGVVQAWPTAGGSLAILTAPADGEQGPARNFVHGGTGRIAFLETWFADENRSKALRSDLIVHDLVSGERRVVRSWPAEGSWPEAAPIEQ